MKILIFGATGMVGQGVLRECVLNPDVDLIQTIGRAATGLNDPKVTEIVRGDMWQYDDLIANFAQFDACFFCLGVSSAGMKEEKYAHVTYDLTLAAAEALSRANPRMTFIYVSGAGTDSSERGRVMWARVKGKTENALLRLPFSAYMFRPGMIEALDGIQPRTPMYRVFYKVFKPILPVLRRAFPDYVVTTEQIGLAMLHVAKKGSERRILESRDIRQAS